MLNVQQTKRLAHLYVPVSVVFCVQVSDTGNYDPFEVWPDADCKRVYDASCSSDAARHWTGWAMRNTNNHNQTVLKKSCIGLLVCSLRSTTGCDVRLRPAICSKARGKQLGNSKLVSAFGFVNGSVNTQRL